MVRKLTFALLAGTALSFAGAANAADIYSPPPEPVAMPAPEAWSWTGVHFGIGAGGQFDFADSYTEAYEWWNEDYAESWGDLGAVNWFATAEIGADYQFGGMVIGILANYDWHPSKAYAEHGGYSDRDYNWGRLAAQQVTWGDSWAVGGRLGFAIGQSALVYALGGYTQKEITVDSAYYFQDLNGGPVADSFSYGGWKSGWFAGAGLEVALSQHVTLKGEYRYADYGSMSAEQNCVGNVCNDFPGGDFQWSQVDNLTSHTVRAVLSYRFW
jgi:outer membrane immunogenic protein